MQGGMHLEEPLLESGGETVREEIACNKDETNEGVWALLALCKFLKINT